MLSVDVVISGDAEFMAKLDKLKYGLTNFKPALTEIGKSMENYFSGEVFRSQGGVYGTPWAKLSPKTVVMKEKLYHHFAAQPLIATGTMQRSFVSQASETELVVRNTVPYFVYHQSTEPRHKIPRRQMIGINKDIEKRVRTIISNDINKKLESL